MLRNLQPNIAADCLCLVLLVELVQAQVPPQPPVAIINTTPNRPSFKPGESVLFDGSSSYVDGGASIVSYTWYVGGTQKKSGSSATTYTTSFSLSSGQNSKSVQVKLSLVADNGTSSSKTITITIIRDENKLYYLTDNLGSVRVTVDQYGDPVGYDDYYPFGKVMPGRSNNTSNPHDAYKFTGKELDQENGIDLEYFGARYYDPEIGRWLSVDPILNKKPDALVNKGYLNVSPYNYAFNNPVILVDPNGLSVNCDGCANEMPRNNPPLPINFVDWGNNFTHFLTVKANAVKAKANAYTKTTVENVKKISDKMGHSSRTMAVIGIGEATVGAVITVASDGSGSEIGIPMMKQGAQLARFSISVGTYADVASTTSQVVDAEAFGGSKKITFKQAFKTSANAAVGFVLDRLDPLAAPAMSVPRDATKVMSTQIIDNQISQQ